MLGARPLGGGDVVAEEPARDDAVTAARRRTIAVLRERMAAMGGLPRARAVPAGGGAPAAPASLVHPGLLEPGDPRRLGFEAEACRDGVAWVRRVSVDLAPFLQRAGAPEPVRAVQLLRLCGLAPPDAPPPDWDERAVTVLDIESLGLHGSGVVPFLVGLGVPAGDRLEVDQLLLGEPGAEAALLEALSRRLSGSRALVTYNGRSFDVPVLLARCIVNRASPALFEELLHCDVLTPVRRLFRDRLGACSLRHAEIELLGLERIDDVPGQEAPLRYRRWLRGDAGPLLEGVLQHNQLDLCSTMVLAARMAAHLEGMLVSPHHAADHYRLAVHLEREGLEERVEKHYRDAVSAGRGPWDRQAAHRLARRLDRRGEHAGAAEAYRRLWHSDRHDLHAARRLCLALERSGRLQDALSVAGEAERLSLTLPGWWEARLRGRPRHGWPEDFRRRRTRLLRRLRTATRASAVLMDW